MSPDYRKVTFKRLAAAEAEAKRFLKRLEALHKVMREDSYGIPAKENAALKRASMDLTRSLVDLRKSSDEPRGGAK